MSGPRVVEVAGYVQPGGVSVVYCDSREQAEQVLRDHRDVRALMDVFSQREWDRMVADVVAGKPAREARRRRFIEIQELLEKEADSE